MSEYDAKSMRPRELMCAVCSLGEEDQGAIPEKSREILDAIRQEPDLAISLRCHVGEVFAFQDPDTGEDTAEGWEFRAKQDLEILHKMGLFPGAVLPARSLLHLLIDGIEEVAGICCGAEASGAWQGCPKAKSGCYEKARNKGVEAIIPPRPDGEMKQEKETSLKAMLEAEAISVRPHILLCAVCQYGGGTRPPYAEDNLPELVELMLKKPDIRIKLVPKADWMMCAPCPYRVPDVNGCIIHGGAGGMRNQYRDLRVLEKLGLSFGATMNARVLYKLIFERISGTVEACRIECVKPSIWWDGCGAATADKDEYVKGKEMLVEELGLDLEE